MNQKGFIQFLPLLVSNWKLIAIGLGAAYVAYYIWDCHSTKQEFAQFKANVAAEGRAAQAREAAEALLRTKISDKQEADHATKEAESNAKYLAAVAAAKRLSRNAAESSRVRALSEAAGSLGCPDRQADAARRLERLEVGVLGLLNRGNSAIIRTETCKEWLDEQAIVP